MLKRFSFLFLLLVMQLSYAFAPGKLFSVSTGSISFRSDAPLELIKANSDQLKGVFIAEKKQFAFTISIRSFSGFNSPLQQEHFNENYLESDKYPRATFEGKIIEDIDMKQDGVFSIRAKGNLSLHGVAQERIIKCDLTIKNGVVGIRSNFTVLLADHNIPVPKVVHEKLASEIKIEVKANLIEK